MQGEINVSFTNRPGEEYFITMPNVYARGILFGTMLMELGDVAAVKCPKLDLVCSLDFKVKVTIEGISLWINLEKTSDSDNTNTPISLSLSQFNPIGLLYWYLQRNCRKDQAHLDRRGSLWDFGQVVGRVVHYRKGKQFSSGLDSRRIMGITGRRFVEVCTNSNTALCICGKIGG